MSRADPDHTLSSVNRPCELVLSLLKETSMQSGVGAGGEKPPATRLWSTLP